MSARGVVTYLFAASLFVASWGTACGSSNGGSSKGAGGSAGHALQHDASLAGSGGTLPDASVDAHAPLHCSNHVRDRGETDVDCGGDCAPCTDGKTCAGNTDCTSHHCDSISRTCTEWICPQGMVLVPMSGKNPFCIDQYEVTLGEYSKHVTASPNQWTLAPTTPSAGTVNCSSTDYPPSNQGSDPAYPALVHWCGASAYCRSVGKRLCGWAGAPPAGGLAALMKDPATNDEWYDACSAQGTRTYPYGSTFDVTKCNVAGYMTSADGGLVEHALPGVRLPGMPPNECIGGEPGLYDMSGNESEWTSMCVDGSELAGNPGMECARRGGDYSSTWNRRCSAIGQDYVYADDYLNWAGVRCCADATPASSDAGGVGGADAGHDADSGNSSCIPLPDAGRDASSDGNCIDTTDAGAPMGAGLGGWGGGGGASSYAPNCSNGVRDACETDVDCGGVCAPCAVGKSCRSGADCTSRRCDTCTGKCESRTCPSGMALVPAPGAYSFCIDLHEVTNAEYATFESSATPPPPSAPPTSDGPNDCSWKTSYTPGVWPGVASASVTQVDWCDAYAYCNSVGKRLCGVVAGNPIGSRDEWEDACVSGEPGLVDMNGGVGEWTSNCTDAGPGGGSVLMCTLENACNQSSLLFSNDAQAGTGIRCCTD